MMHTYEQDCILTNVKDNDGYWRKPRGMNAFFIRTEYIQNIRHTGEEHFDNLLPPRATGSDSAAHEP